MTVSAYARQRGVSPQTVRRWIREQGAPCARRGRCGPGGETIVDPDALDEWRAVTAAPATVLRAVATALYDTLMRDAGDGEPAWKSLGIDRDRAAALLVLVYGRIVRALTNDEPDELPSEIVRIRTICQTAPINEPRRS